MELKRIYLDQLSNHLKIGIIGATNVGKSCLYNVLTKLPDNEAAVDNSLFTTIDPSIGIVSLEDPRMHTIQSYLPTPRRFKQLKVTVFDTAGLITGAFREVCILENSHDLWSKSLLSCCSYRGRGLALTPSNVFDTVMFFCM